MLTKFITLGAILAATSMFAGCETKPTDIQPSTNSLVVGDRGIQARDVKEMTDLMVRSITAKVAAVNAANPYKITVTVYPPTAKDGKDYGLLTSSLMVNLARSNNPNVAFVENRSNLTAVQARELGTTEDPNRAPGTSDRLLPQYLLTGEVQTMPNQSTTYFLISFKLVRIMPGASAGEIVWLDGYDLLSIN